MTTVTLADVRNALAGTDPNQSNAGKIRAALGRGSNQTIQRYLEVLRAEAVAPVPEAEHQGPPPAPADALRAIWVAAYTAARAEVLARTDRLAAERDAAHGRIESLSRDVDALAIDLDEALAHEQAAQAAAQAAQAAAAGHQAELVRVRAELAQVQAQAAHAEQLAEAGRAALRAEMAHLLDQVSELKAALYHQRQA